LGGAALLEKVRRILGNDRRREQTRARALQRREFGEVTAVVSELKKASDAGSELTVVNCAEASGVGIESEAGSRIGS
jgi:hypothetical protein